MKWVKVIECHPSVLLKQNIEKINQLLSLTEAIFLDVKQAEFQKIKKYHDFLAKVLKLCHKPTVSVL